MLQKFFYILLFCFFPLFSSKFWFERKRKEGTWQNFEQNKTSEVVTWKQDVILRGVTVLVAYSLNAGEFRQL